jgi:hypothetical protein
MPISDPIQVDVLLASSPALSWFGCVYFGIPAVVLLTAAIVFSSRTCRLYWLVLSGAVVAGGAAVLVGAFAENRGPNFDDWLPVAINIAVCIGSVLGVLSFRIGHELLRRRKMQDKYLGT